MIPDLDRLTGKRTYQQDRVRKRLVVGRVRSRARGDRNHRRSNAARGRDAVEGGFGRTTGFRQRTKDLKRHGTSSTRDIKRDLWRRVCIAWLEYQIAKVGIYVRDPVWNLPNAI